MRIGWSGPAVWLSALCHLLRGRPTDVLLIHACKPLRHHAHGLHLCPAGVFCLCTAGTERASDHMMCLLKHASAPCICLCGVATFFIAMHKTVAVPALPSSSTLEQNSAGTLHIRAKLFYRTTGGARCKAFIANTMGAATALSHLRPRGKGASGILCSVRTRWPGSWKKCGG